MPVAVAVFSDTIPGIWVEDSDSALLERLKDLPAAPELTTLGSAQKWLATLPAPSGWYDSISQAKAATDQMRARREGTS